MRLKQRKKTENCKSKRTITNSDIVREIPQVNFCAFEGN
jgi:hypothetical protein